jgi:hypothetical protein
MSCSDRPAALRALLRSPKPWAPNELAVAEGPKLADPDLDLRGAAHRLAADLDERDDLIAPREESLRLYDRLLKRTFEVFHEPLKLLLTWIDAGLGGSVSHSISGDACANTAFQSPRFMASYIWRTISTFSCDIAYSERPAASRASAFVRNSMISMTLPPRNQYATA